MYLIILRYAVINSCCIWKISWLVRSVCNSRKHAQLAGHLLVHCCHHSRHHYMYHQPALPWIVMFAEPGHSAIQNAPFFFGIFPGKYSHTLSTNYRMAKIFSGKPVWTSVVNESCRLPRKKMIRTNSAVLDNTVHYVSSRNGCQTVLPSFSTYNSNSLTSSKTTFGIL